jgi:hypothetical protein
MPWSSRKWTNRYNVIVAKVLPPNTASADAAPLRFAARLMRTVGRFNGRIECIVEVLL